MAILQTSYQIRPLLLHSIQNFSTSHLPTPPHQLVSLQKSSKSIRSHRLTIQSQQTQKSELHTNTQDDGIPADDVKILARFKSRHNYIRVLEVSRRADHPFAGSRLLLLDGPGNIHSISFLLKSLTNTYFDVFATLPPIIPPGPIGILGFGAGSAARTILKLYPKGSIHGWELDPSVISVGREYFGLSKLEKDYPDRLFIYIGDALRASVREGFSGILVDLFSKGSLIPELQDPNTWEMLRKCLRKGGRVMVNVGGSCVEAEDRRRDGKLVMEDTLKAMHRVFRDKLFVLSLGNRKDDSSLALTGALPDLEAWKKALPRSLVGYVDMWMPFSSKQGGKLIALSHKSDGFDGSRKITKGEEGNSQSEILGKIGKKVVPFRSLRVLNSPPPSPAKSKATAMNTPAPPPLLA